MFSPAAVILFYFIGHFFMRFVSVGGRENRSSRLVAVGGEAAGVELRRGGCGIVFSHVPGRRPAVTTPRPAVEALTRGDTSHRVGPVSQGTSTRVYSRLLTPTVKNSPSLVRFISRHAIVCPCNRALKPLCTLQFKP